MMGAAMAERLEQQWAGSRVTKTAVKWGASRAAPTVCHSAERKADHWDGRKAEKRGDCLVVLRAGWRAGWTEPQMAESKETSWAGQKDAHSAEKTESTMAATSAPQTADPKAVHWAALMAYHWAERRAALRAGCSDDHWAVRWAFCLAEWMEPPMAAWWALTKAGRWARCLVEHLGVHLADSRVW